MNDVIITSTLLNFLWVFIAFVVMRSMLWHFDKGIGFDFAEWLKNASDIAKAIYLSGRIVAVAIVVSAIVS